MYGHLKPESVGGFDCLRKTKTDESVLALKKASAEMRKSLELWRIPNDRTILVIEKFVACLFEHVVLLNLSNLKHLGGAAHISSKLAATICPDLEEAWARLRG